MDYLIGVASLTGVSLILRSKSSSMTLSVAATTYLYSSISNLQKEFSNTSVLIFSYGNGGFLISLKINYAYYILIVVGSDQTYTIPILSSSQPSVESLSLSLNMSWPYFYLKKCGKNDGFKAICA